MTNKQRKTFLSVVYSIIFFFCMAYALQKKELDISYFLAALIFPSILTYIIGIFIPAKKKTSAPKKQANLSTKKKSLTDMELLTADINSLSGIDFERLIFLYFKDKGFNPETTPRTGDHGVDLVIKDPKDGLKIAVQCKRWKQNIGNGDIIKLDGGKRFYRCPGALFITTSNYTDKAKEFAEKCNVDLWNGLHVKDKIDSWRKEKVKKSS